MFWTHLFWPKRYTRQTKQKLHWKSLIVIKGSKPHFFLLISIPQSKVTENYLFILFFKDASWSNLFSWLIAQVNFFTLVHSGQALSQARTALAVQGLRFHASFARGGHLTPGLETKIPHPSRGQEKNNSPRNKSFLIKKKKRVLYSFAPVPFHQFGLQNLQKSFPNLHSSSNEKRPHSPSLCPTQLDQSSRQ